MNSSFILMAIKSKIESRKLFKWPIFNLFERVINIMASSNWVYINFHYIIVTYHQEDKESNTKINHLSNWKKDDHNHDN